MKRTLFSLEPLEVRSLLSGLATSLTTDLSTYQPGQPVVMTFKETNTSSTPVAVQAGPSIDGFNVTQSGHSVWRSNAGINPLFITMVPLQPGQSLTLTATWDGIPEGGSSPSTGTFVIANQLDPQGPVATVTVKDSTSSSPSSPATPTGGASEDSSPTSSSSGGSASSPPSSSTLGPGDTSPSPVALTVRTNHSTIKAGQPIHMTLTLKTLGRGRVAVPAGTTSDGFTVLEGLTTLWHSSATRPTKVRHGGAIQLDAVWNGRDPSTGASVAPGTYTIEAVEGNAASSTTIRVRG